MAEDPELAGSILREMCPAVSGAVYSHGRPSSRFRENHQLSAPGFLLNPSLLGRPAPVMGDRSHILDRPHFDARRRKRAHGRFPARARTADPYLHRSQTAFRRFVSRGQRGLLCCEWRALARSTESQRTGAGPSERVAFLIGNRHDRVVERRLNMHDPGMDDALFLLLETLLLARLRGFCWCFRHIMSSPTPSSCSRPCRAAALCAYARWYGCAGPAPQDFGDAADPDTSPS